MIGRAFIVLGAFDAKSPRLTQSEISRRSGLPLPTVHRLCGQLVAEGALERRSDGKYQVGVRLWEIGALAPGAHGLRQVALPFLEDLYEVTRENVQLVVREGTEALYLERLSSRSAVTVVGRAGGRLPLHASSGGLILLAHGGTELLDDVLRAGLESFTPKTITSERILRATLDEITAASHSSVRWLMVSGSPTAGGLAGYLKKGTASIASQPPTAMVIANNGPDIPVSRRA